MRNSYAPGARDERPWGSWEVLAAGEEGAVAFAVKRITVRPGGVLSLQRHRHRQEQWVIVQGRAAVWVDGERIECGPEDSVRIPRGSWHRIACLGEEPLVFIEVQTGALLSEDDIERREDLYGRV